MSKETIKVGDVVRLKSGGLDMTVCELPTEYKDSVMCVWLNKDGDVRTNLFLIAVLESSDGFVFSATTV